MRETEGNSKSPEQESGDFYVIRAFACRKNEERFREHEGMPYT